MISFKTLLVKHLDRGDDFYEQVLSEQVRSGILNQQMRILVTCGGELDKAVISKCGFNNVLITSLHKETNNADLKDPRIRGENAERLPFGDNSFDFCIVHSGLHHCSSPHRALLEMYRVAIYGVLLFEPYDNLTTRLGVALGFGQTYEHAAVFFNDWTCGGVNNTSVPNYVYRWTQRELKKTICSFAPWGRHRFRFIHELRIPWRQLSGRKNRLVLWSIVLVFPFVKAINAIFPIFTNCFAAIVLKPQTTSDLHPWVKYCDGSFQINIDWFRSRYR